MQIIKIPFSLKFYLFSSLFWLFLALLWLDYGYWYFGINIIYVWIFSLFLFIIQLIFLFKYFKNPSKYSNVNIYIIIFIIFLYLIGTILNWYYILILIYQLLFLIKFFRFKKALNLENWEKRDKYIKYTNKNQYKNTLIVYLIIILSLVFFYFVQYNKVIDFKHIDDNYFNIPEKYLNISDKENWFNNLKLYSKHISKLKFVENEKFRKNISKPWISLNDLELNINRVREIDNLRLWIDKIIDKKVIIYDFSEKLPYLEWYSNLFRESLYSSLYFLKKWDEIKSLNYLLDDYKLSHLMISSYWPLVNSIVWVVWSKITLDNLNYIIDNYRLKQSTLKYIKDNLKNSLDIRNSYKIAMIYEYNSALNTVKTNKNSFPKNTSLIFFSKKYYKEWLKNVYYWFLEKYNFWKVNSNWYYNNNSDYYYDSVTNLQDNYICSKKNTDKLRWNWIIPKLFFRKNPTSNILLVIHCSANASFYPDFKNLIIKEKKILEKIDNLLIK